MSTQLAENPISDLSELKDKDAIKMCYPFLKDNYLDNVFQIMQAVCNGWLLLMSRESKALLYRNEDYKTNHWMLDTTTCLTI